MTSLRKAVPLLLFFGMLAFAQNGAIQGIILDAGGATVPNAKVTALDQEKQLIARETVSSTDGSFTLRPLLPGRYTVSIEAPGFKKLERTDLVLDQNQVMALGSVSLRGRSDNRVCHDSGGSPAGGNRQLDARLHHHLASGDAASAERPRFHVADAHTAGRGHELQQRLPSCVQQHRPVQRERPSRQHEQRFPRRIGQHRRRRE